MNIIFATFLKDSKNFISYRFNFFGEVIVITTLITIIFFISKIFSESTSEYLSNYGNNYFDFLFTGMIIIFFSTRTISSIPFFISNMQMLGILEKLVVKDKFILIVISHFTFPMIQSFFRLVLFYLISLLLPSSSINLINFIEIFLVLVPMALSILGISLIIASFVLVEKKATFLSSLIILSIVLFSGVLYPIEVMPDLIQKISYVMPTRLGVDLIRARTINDMSFLEIMPQIMFMIAVGVALTILGIYLLNIALEKAKNNGTISHY